MSKITQISYQPGAIPPEVEASSAEGTQTHTHTHTHTSTHAHTHIRTHTLTHDTNLAHEGRQSIGDFPSAAGVHIAIENVGNVAIGPNVLVAVGISVDSDFR